MSSYFVTPYTIHFDDTIAYGSHHFMTAFKLQCAGRESLLFGQWVYDQPSVKQDLEGILLLTAEAYSRNLSAAQLGDRLAVLMTTEEVGRVSMRFCFRVLKADGTPVCCGYQTVVCADAKTGEACSFPSSLRHCFEALQDLIEPLGERTIKQRVSAGGREVESLFDPATRELARAYLSTREQTPSILERSAAGTDVSAQSANTSLLASAPDSQELERALHVQEHSPAILLQNARQAWCFSGQGSFDAGLLSARIQALPAREPELSEAVAVIDPAAIRARRAQLRRDRRAVRG